MRDTIPDTRFLPLELTVIRTAIITRAVAVCALLLSPMPANAQKTGGVVGSNDVTNAICGGSCESLANGTRAEDAALRAAIASVPVSRRPLGFVLRTKWVPNGTTLGLISTPWALFPNGTATACYGWDPRQISPTPTALRTFDKGCDEVASWRRTEKGIVLTDADGEVSEPYDPSGVLRFAPGQRFAQRMRSYGPSIASPVGTSPFVMVNINEMVFASAGTVRLASNRRVWQGGDGTNRTTVDDGRYFLDGYLAAVRFPDGRIEIAITGHVLSQSNTPDFGLTVWNGVIFARE